MAYESSLLRKVLNPAAWRRRPELALQHPQPVQHYFTRPLRPVSFPGQGEKPMWAAAGYDPENLVGISERFLSKADIYTETYTHSENILDLLRRAIAWNDIPIGEMRAVLDFGSGPGTNTVFPLHLINPELQIVATDISLNLLATLSSLLAQHRQRDLVDIVAWDCMAGGIRPNSFDLVTGASLLHHLMDPRKALRTAHEALKPGGYAFFVDPFDGAGLVRGLYQALLKANVGHNERLRDDTVEALHIMSRDYEARLAGSEPEHFTYLEDKWIFSQEWIVEQGRQAGFSSVVVRGNLTSETMYRDYVLIQMRMCSGPQAAELPAWAIEILDAFDASMTPSARARMMLEGTIVMRK
jgi:SAM-dependent methyltransferase